MSKPIAQQQVEFYINDNRTKPAKANLELFKSYIVLTTENKKVQKIRTPFDLSTVISLKQSKTFTIQHSKGNLLTILAPNAREWVKLLNFYLVRDLVRGRHVHPLTLITNGRGTCKVCSAIMEDRSDQRCFVCEFCTNHDIYCYECYGSVDELVVRCVKSTAHKHLLYEYDVPPMKILMKLGATCSICHRGCGYLKDLTYHCLDCLDYIECAQCHIAPNNKPGIHESLNLQHFSEYLQIISKQEIAVKKDVKIPANVSLITDGYWDISNISTKPVDNAYFEVEFLSFRSDTVVGIGIGCESVASHALLGTQRNSFAYLNNGEMRRHGTVERNEVEFHPGDTVGCGILLDNYSIQQVYFTLNGKLLDKCMPIPADEMNCFPGICFTNESMVHFKTNFKGPFKFDVKKVPNYRNNRNNYFELLPAEVMDLLLQYIARTPLAVFSNMQLVNKAWRDYLMNNTLWRDAFLHRWIHQNPRVKIRDWKLFYKKRKQALSDKRQGPSQPIENCDREECRLIWQQLEATKQQGVSHCKTCNQNVYAVSDKATLQSYVQMGRCVVYKPSSWNVHINLEDYERPVLGDMFGPNDDEDW